MPATTTTPCRSTATACSSTSPTWRRSCPRKGRSRPRPPAGRRRCTCPAGVDPMLPERLSSDLCSLLPGRDRWAVTVEVGGDGPLRAFRSLIRSDHRLTYDEAEAMLSGGEGPPDLVAALRRLDGLAAERAAARLARGGISVETAERTFRIAAGEVMDGHRRTGRRRAQAGGGAHAGRQRGGRDRAGRRRRGAAVPRPRAARAGGARPRWSSGSRRSPCPRRPCPRCTRAPMPPASPGCSARRWRGMSAPRAAAARRSPAWCCGRCARPATTRSTAATPASPAGPTATSPRPSAAIPT